jgi:hypothetical protein
MRPRRRQATPLFFAVVLITAFVAVVYASTTLQTNFNNAYPLSDYPNSAPLHNNCSVCHPGYNTNSFNSYATDLRSAGGNFRAIENDDSDNDGFSNIAEITAGTFPGDGSSHPVLDTTAPLITINSPTTSSTYSTDVSSISLAGTATDGVGVVLVGWSNSGGGSGTCSGTTSWNCSGINLSSGENVITVTALDAADNAGADMLTVTCTPTDNAAPEITSFSIPSTSTSMTVPITSLTATDDVYVSGFILTESPAAPDPNAEGWSATAPASYTFSPVNVSTSGYQAEANMTKVLYAWAKDAAGNVSAGASASTVIELPPVDLSEMAAWEGKWFRVVISGLDQSATVGYLKIQSWNFNPPILQSELFMREIGEKGGKGKKKEEGGVDTWNSSVLNLLYTSGDPLRFFFSFDYLNLFGFSGGIDGKLDRNGMLARATVTMAGVYLPGTEDTEFGEYEGHDGSDEDDDVNNPGDLVTIRGRLTSEWLVPMEVLATEGTEPNAQTENERLLYRSRSKELRPGSSPREKHGEGDSL